jgi:hypothetical protein
MKVARWQHSASLWQARRLSEPRARRSPQRGQVRHSLSTAGDDAGPRRRRSHPGPRPAAKQQSGPRSFRACLCAGLETLFRTIQESWRSPPSYGDRHHVHRRAESGRLQWFQHEGEFLKAGGTKEQLAALKAGGGPPGQSFDETERAALALTWEMTRDIEVKPATMKRIRAVLPTRRWSS